MKEPEVEQFVVRAESIAKRRGLQENSILTRTYQGIRAGQHVGVLVAPNRNLEILPKIDTATDDNDKENKVKVRQILVQLLAVVNDIRISENEITALSTQKYDLLEIFIQLFLDRLSMSVNRGLPRRYTEFSDDLNVLRGKLNVIRQLTCLAARPDYIACRYHQLSENTPLNRVLKSTITRLVHISNSPRNVQMSTELISRFHNVIDSSFPLRESVRLDRSNSAFHDLYQLALLFLTDNWQQTTSGKDSGFALLFSMNHLFEKFIGLSLERALVNVNDVCSVTLQDSTRHALIDEKKQKIYRLRPDAVIKTSSECIILDTKWKDIFPNHPAIRNMPQNVEIATSDIYQMITYARAYSANRIILLFPCPRFDGSMTITEGVIRRWKLKSSKLENIECFLEIAVIDFCNPDGVNNLRFRDIVEESLRNLILNKEIVNSVD